MVQKLKAPISEKPAQIAKIKSASKAQGVARMPGAAAHGGAGSGGASGSLHQPRDVVAAVDGLVIDSAGLLFYF